MRLMFLVFAIVVGFALSPPVEAQQREIQGVISSQIDAFKTDDFATAFTYAAPTIQGMFRTPENFGRMVSQGYPMVWRPADVTYLDLRMVEGQVFQDVQIVDSQGRAHILEYHMTEFENGWKISGVRLLEMPGVAV